jgi:hypothetical protein
MEWYVIMGYILFGCFAIGVSVVTMLIALKRQKSMIDRARKIDPTVETIWDADYVLKKDLAQNVGKNKE